MQCSNSLKMPKAVYSGEAALEQLKVILKDNVKKAAVFSDPGIKNAGLLDLPLAYIEECGIVAEIISEISAEPTCDQAQEVIEQFKKTGADFIIAIGGGSVMDIAKLASILATDDYTVRDLLERPSSGVKQVRTLMIPTTAGTGSEVTPNSIVAVPEKQLKVGIVNEAMIADYVILDARMIKNLPANIAAATGVDALAHAIECYTSRKASPFSDLFALEALDLIVNNIEQACESSDNMEAKNAMQIAAFYAGAAITASGTTAVHALSYPLGGKYHISHGVSNAMLLVPVMKFNEPACRQRLEKAYDRIAPENLSRNISREEKSVWIIKRLEEIVRNLKIPSNLKEFGVGKEALEELVASGMEVTRLLNNNMRNVTAEDARALYLQILI